MKTSQPKSAKLCLVQVVAALIATLIFSLPLIFLLAAGGSYLPFANESLAYRYFTSLRILDGQGSAVWTAQGQLVTAIQNIIVTMLQFATATDFKARLEYFGFFTNMAASLSMFAVNLCATLDDRLRFSDKALVLILGPAIIFGTINAGFYYSILPDYYALSLVIISASVYLTLRFYRDDPVFSTRDLCFAGILCGLAAANKLTLLGPAGIVALIAIVRIPLDPGRFFKRTVLTGVICITTFGFIFLGVYAFNLRDAIIVFRHTLGFLKSAGAEPGFWEGNFWMFQEIYNYDKLFFAWAAATLYLAFEIWRLRAWRAAIILIANLFVAVLLCIGLYKRGAGTTFFELSSILAGLAALSLAVGLGLRARTVWAMALPAVIFAAALSQFDFSHNWGVVTKSRELARKSWEIREYAAGLGRPTVVVIPDESYVSNGIEDLLNKGLRDLATNSFGSAKAMKERIAPRTDFRQEPGVIAVGTAVVWFEKWDIAADRPLKETKPEEARRWQTLSQIASINTCRTWRTGYSNQVLVYACIVDRIQ
jgi:hypothetical protein